MCFILLSFGSVFLLCEDDVADLVVVVAALLLPARPKPRGVGVVAHGDQAVGALQQPLLDRGIDIYR